MADKEPCVISSVDQELEEADIQTEAGDRKPLLLENGGGTEREETEMNDMKGQTKSVEDQSVLKKEGVVVDPVPDRDIKQDDPAVMESECNAKDGDPLLDRLSRPDDPAKEESGKEEPMDTASDDIACKTIETLDQSELVCITSNGLEKSEPVNAASHVACAVDAETVTKSELVNTVSDEVKKSEVANVASDVAESEPADTVVDAGTVTKSVTINTRSEKVEKGEVANPSSDVHAGDKDEPVDAELDAATKDKMMSDDAKSGEPVHAASDEPKATKPVTSNAVTDDVKESETSEKAEPVDTATQKTSEEVKKSETSEKSDPVDTAVQTTSEEVKKNETSEKADPVDTATQKTSEEAKKRETSEKAEPIDTAAHKMSEENKESETSEKADPVDKAAPKTSEEAKKEMRASGKGTRYKPFDERIVRGEIDFCGRDLDGEELKKGYVPTPRPKLLATSPTFTEPPPGAAFFKEVSRRAILQIEYEDPFENIKLFSLVGIEKRPITLRDVPTDYRPYKGCIFVSEYHCNLHV